MAWEKLSPERLKALPFLLAGPILRQVTSKAVTVWVALKQPATVWLYVYKGNGDEAVMPAGRRHTTAIGTNLHIVAVTARSTRDLSEESVYSYDLTFDLEGEPAASLKLSEVFGTSFAYAPWKRPSFALPPRDLNSLRLIHGSCRKPNGEGDDMLAELDMLITETALTANGRPHQLLLTGDQIYADEVADGLLLLLTDVGEVLLGWEESMPSVGNRPGPFKARDLPPASRGSYIQKAGFTTSDRRSHLMSLGEYLAMYLFAWSDVLWPKPDMWPTVDDIVAEHRLHPTPIQDWDSGLSDMSSKAPGQTKEVQNYAATVGKVRRALANIPSYMIFDDHEITDDWNMTREFCDKVYGNPLGLRVVQNGLVAFSLCQAWGNTPEQFEADPNNRRPAGLKLLELLEKHSAYDANSGEIQVIVGLHNAQTLRQQAVYRVYHESGVGFPVHGVHVDDKSLRFHFTIEGPGHQVLVTDTRTWRSFPHKGPVTPPDLIAQGTMVGQIGILPPLGTRLLLVVVSTNMPPIPGIRQAERQLKFKKSLIYGKDLLDSWRLPSAALDQMMRLLTNRLPRIDGVHTGPIVLLSGDVHSSHTSRLAFWANTRFGDAQDARQPAQAVLAHLVASALKNEAEDTRGQHKAGYSYVPKWYLKLILDKPAPEGIIGWNPDPQVSGGILVGRQSFAQARPSENLRVNLSEPSLRLPALDKVNGSLKTIINRNTPPHFHYRYDVIRSSAGDKYPDEPPRLPPFDQGVARQRALVSYSLATNAYRNYALSTGAGKEIVGYNNIGEITFQWGEGATDKLVYHTLRWREPKNEGELNEPLIRWARFSVPFDIKHRDYKMLKHWSEQ